MSLRSLAHAHGVSTQVLYSLFGSKAALLDAIVARAASSLARGQAAALDAPHPLVRLYQLGQAYRSWALSHPAWFEVLFGSSLRRHPPERVSVFSGPLLDTLTDLVDSGIYQSQPVDLLAQAHWALVHGLVSVELLDPPVADDEQLAAAERFRHILMLSGRAWLAPGVLDELPASAIPPRPLRAVRAEAAPA